MTDVVIGAGIVGASCAYHLLRHGHPTVLIDAHRPGRATDAGAGIVSALGDGPTGSEWDAFGFQACEYYPELATQLTGLGEARHGWARAGQLIVSTEQYSAANGKNSSLDAVRGYAARLAEQFGPGALGFPEVVDRTGIARRWPGLRARSAVWLDRVARVDGRRFRGALLGACRRLGGHLRMGSAALSLHGDRVVAHVARERVDADAIVLAAGAWSGQLLQAVGIPGGWVRPQRGQILHLRMPGCGTRPIVMTPDRHYLVAFPGDRLVIGATREDDPELRPFVTMAGVNEVITSALRVAPDLTRARLIESRVGLRPRSADGLPVLGRVPGMSNLYVATGLGHTGLTLGPHSGRVVADLVAARDGDPQWPVPAAFDSQRLAGWSA